MAPTIRATVALVLVSIATWAYGYDCARTEQRLIGSSADGLAVAGTTAVIGAGPTLVFVDISTPADPRPVAELRTGDVSYPFGGGGWIRPLATVGGHVLVSTGGDLDVYDVSDPAAPTVVGSLELGFTAYQAVVSDGLAWLAGDRTVAAVDASDPALPREVSRFGTDFGITGIAVEGELAAVLEQSSQLTVLDVSDPTEPQVLSSLTLPGSSWALTIAADRAYVAGPTGITAVGLADPASPVLIGVTDTGAIETAVAALRVAGGRLYLGHYQNWYSRLYPSGGLQVLDLSDPDHPSPLYSLTFSSGAVGLMVVDDHLLALDVDSGLRVFDLDPSGPPLQVGAFNPTRNDVFAVGVEDDLAFVADQGLRVLDLAGESAPAEIGALELRGWVSDLAVAPQPLLVVEQWRVDEPGTARNLLLVVDRSDPRRPRARGEIDLPVLPGLDPTYLALRGDLAAVAAQEEGLLLIGLEDPDHPVELGRTATVLPARKVELADGLAVVASSEDWTGGPREGRLELYDVSNPAAPVLAGVATLPSDPQALAVTDGLALVACRDSFRVIDISDPAAPSEVGALDLALYRATAIAVDGDRALVSVYPGSLVAVDLTDLVRPRLVAGTTWQAYVIVDGGPMGGWDVAVHDGRAVVADGGFGLRVVSVGRCGVRPQRPNTVAVD